MAQMDPAAVANSSVGRSGVDADGEIAEMRREMSVQELRMTEQRSRARVENQLDMLSLIAKTLRVLPGRKQLILLSEGFDPKLIQGRQWQAESSTENDLILQGRLWNVDNDQRYGSTSSLTMLDRMDIHPESIGDSTGKLENLTEI